MSELVDKFILSVKSVDEIFSENFNEKRFCSSKRALSKELERLGNCLKEFQNLDWDILNIAFFGETGIGKSTLIEALIGGDGKSIGTGVKDFTTEIKVYFFDKDIKLLDMPGIEGDEKKVENEIWKAVNRAHIIFYILSHTKEPEKNTLLKIRKYLNKNAYVYALINIHGIRPPKALENSIEGKIKIVKERTEKYLKEYLGDSFKGIFIVHTLFAFFSRAKSIPHKLLAKYKNALRYYSQEKLEEISNIKKIEEIIKRENQRKNIVIPWGYTKKILISQKNIIDDISYLKEVFDETLKGIIEELNVFQSKLREYRNLLKNNIGKLIETETVKFEKQLLKFFNEVIEKKYDKSKIERDLQKLENNFFRNLEGKIEKEIQCFLQRGKDQLEMTAKKIKYFIKILNKYFYKKADREASVKNSNINMEIILNFILEKLKWDANEIINEIIKLIMGLTIGALIASGSGNVWIFIVALIVPIIERALSFFRLRKKKKMDAKRAAWDKVKKRIEKIKKIFFVR